MIKIPVFAGRDESGDLYILYKEEVDELDFSVTHDRKIQAPEDHFLKLPNGEMWALAPGSELNLWQQADHNHSLLKIQSEVWTGELRGSRLDLIEAKILGPE